MKTYQSGKSNLLFIVIAIAAIAVGFLAQLSNSPDNQAPDFEKTILLPQPKPITMVPFSTHLDQPFDAVDWQGRWSIVFYGFTNCPDVCPTTMQTLKQVKADLVTAGVWQNFRIIMVSVDPKRDTSERLAQYVPFFDAEFIGLRADTESTTEFAKQMGILFINGQDSGEANYDVDHSASIILIDPQARYAGVMTAPHSAEIMTRDLIKLASYRPATAAAVTSPATLTREVNAMPSSAQSAVNAEGSAVTITNAWIRPAPSTASSMAAYLDITNNTSVDVTFTTVEADGFAMSMLHETMTQNEMTSMRHVDELNVPAGHTVHLAPMGKHIMLMRPEKPLQLGDVRRITLITSDGERFSRDVEVRTPEVN
ncbi:hypothetical protein GCM10008090_18260 [Arenicella chitinivorans]|uniref:Thioredoxin domain-containing protein n=1 Tax=Arenicella chitinivorans TaxID=1329800 RepID=A0A918RSQ0_9GAMM|nr:SCO family protein [Arenicella chitinivorans]GHA08739.1 hypothetical protein GCM10008090_18260 [Arenicella chitinivorans]